MGTAHGLASGLTSGQRRLQVGRTPTVLVRDDLKCAYPIVEGVPVLLAPERLVPAAGGPLFVDLDAPKYAEAYEEMDFYTAEADQAAAALDDWPVFQRLVGIRDLPPDERRKFPAPASRWLDSMYEPTAQWDAYRHLAPVDGQRVLQIGGKGHHAVTLLLAGASEAWLVSPMVSELLHAQEMARRLGLESRMHCVAGVAEELPLPDGFLDAIYTISAHHMVADLAFPECARVLRPGGRFAAVEPWRAPLYRLGTTLLGKRQVGVNCRPMTMRRVAPFLDAFPGGRVVHHGALLRYPMLALMKFGVEPSLVTTWRVARVDDAVSSLIPGLRRMGSCAALLGAKTA